MLIFGLRICAGKSAQKRKADGTGDGNKSKKPASSDDAKASDDLKKEASAKNDSDSKNDDSAKGDRGSKTDRSSKTDRNSKTDRHSRSDDKADAKKDKPRSRDSSSVEKKEVRLFISPSSWSFSEYSNLLFLCSAT